jgi:HK97 gp10 family phage protein
LERIHLEGSSVISVADLDGLAKRLAQLDLAPTERSALGHAAAMLQDAVRQRLSHTPGEMHDAPWLRSGVLRASVTHEADDTEAVVGSADPVAIYQECGTRTDPPRPFLAPAGAAEAPRLAAEIAAAVLGRLQAVFR